MAYTKYSLTPANNTAAPPDGAPEGMLPSAVNDTMRDMMAQIRDCGDGVRDGTYTMTAPKITGGTITGVTLTGNTFSSPVISGETINNANIGATTATTGKFTTLTNSALTSGRVTYAGASGLLSDSATLTYNGTTLTATTGANFCTTSGSVGIGTSSPNRLLSLYATQPVFQITNVASGNTQGTIQYQESGATNFILDNQGSGSGGAIVFQQAGTERMRIDSSGNLLLNTTSGYTGKLRVNNTSDDGVGIQLSGAGGSALVIYVSNTNQNYAYFVYNGTATGSISTNGTVTSYNVSSDYRLKENIAPMTGALATVAQLNPVTYKWKADGSDGQGFIAHELQAVVSDCVTGEKDAIDADGKPKYQGIDTSFLVATLTKAIQEQQALIESLTTRLTALENK